MWEFHETTEEYYLHLFCKEQPDSDLSEEVLFPGSEYYAARPRLHEYVKEIGAILEEYNAFSVGEMPYGRDVKEVIKGVRQDRRELNTVIHFEL